MSADNWSKCPKCRSVAEKAIEKAESDLVKDYGKVSFENYQKRLDSIKEMQSALDEFLQLNNVREDYYIGIEEQIFEVDFRANCRDCDFAFTYKVEFDVLSMTEIGRDVRPSRD